MKQPDAVLFEMHFASTLTEEQVNQVSDNLIEEVEQLGLLVGGGMDKDHFSLALDITHNAAIDYQKGVVFLQKFANSQPLVAELKIIDPQEG